MYSLTKELSDMIQASASLTHSIRRCLKGSGLRPLFYISLAGLLFLGFVGRAAAVTGSEAVEASKAATEVQDLLSQYPSSSYAIVSSILWKGVGCWKVMWWTEDHLEAKLYYPNVIVYVDKDEGGIVQVLVPRGSEGEYPLPDNVTLQASSETVNIDLEKQITLSGRISPPLAATVALEYTTDGKDWHILAITTSNEDGSYSCTWAPPVGSYQVKARTLSAASEVVMIQVVPEFNKTALVQSPVLAATLIIILMLFVKIGNGKGLRRSSYIEPRNILVEICLHRPLRR